MVPYPPDAGCHVSEVGCVQCVRNARNSLTAYMIIFEMKTCKVGVAARHHSLRDLLLGICCFVFECGIWLPYLTFVLNIWVLHCLHNYVSALEPSSRTQNRIRNFLVSHLHSQLRFLQRCFKIYDWLSLHCLALQIKHFHPVYRSKLFGKSIINKTVCKLDRITNMFFLHQTHTHIYIDNNYLYIHIYVYTYNHLLHFYLHISNE